MMLRTLMYVVSLSSAALGVFLMLRLGYVGNIFDLITQAYIGAILLSAGVMILVVQHVCATELDPALDTVNHLGYRGLLILCSFLCVCGAAFVLIEFASQNLLLALVGSGLCMTTGFAFTVPMWWRSNQ
jgi:hypothetical protein